MSAISKIAFCVITSYSIHYTKLYDYQVALPELNAELRKDIERLTHVPHTGFSLIACFGQAHDSRFGHFTRRLFDRFRCPLLRIQVALEERWMIKAIEPITPADLSPHEFDFFLGALEGYTRAHWRTPKAKTPPRYSLAVLHNPREALPPRITSYNVCYTKLLREATAPIFNRTSLLLARKSSRGPFAYALY